MESKLDLEVFRKAGKLVQGHKDFFSCIAISNSGACYSCLERKFYEYIFSFPGNERDLYKMSLPQRKNWRLLALAFAEVLATDEELRKFL